MNDTHTYTFNVFKKLNNSKFYLKISNKSITINK